MNQQIVYNLEEFATKYNLKDIYGAYAAHISITGEESGHLSDIDVSKSEDNTFYNMMAERTLFTKLFLVKQGNCRLNILVANTRQELVLAANDFLIVTPQETACIKETSHDFKAESILVDKSFAKQAQRYQLNDVKYKSIYDIFHFVRDIVRHQHINKVEMIRSMFNVLKLIIDELPYEQCSVSHDLGHKKEVYEVFLHHLYRHFRKERQIRFYADKLNVSAPYISRLVKEISGSTVYDHVSSLIYKEICNLLTQTDMTMGEIADQLSFSDQSAMTNFFKQRSGMTPLAYRNR
ncbi:helix-turn-helix domain-containing protein [Prevotella sp.]|uniref:helix-turn-helix domain-containing protein n=1 Tax=Prevotella sp. TaxID=59823 RepID=UPI0026001E6A|nr:helix-turn-helix domain-containing protein [Prevotella sp.]